MTDDRQRLLVFGFGNPGRLDDGLGPAFVKAVEGLGLTGIATEADYQLTVEDADLVATYDLTLFVDATIEDIEPFHLAPVTPEAEVSFSSHKVSPGQVYHLARTLFDADTRAYILAIRGYDYDAFGERLSTGAAENLNQAVAFFHQLVGDSSDLGTALREAADADGCPSSGRVHACDRQSRS